MLRKLLRGGVKMFRHHQSSEPHLNFDSSVHGAICKSDSEPGVALDELPVGTVLEVETRDHVYKIETRGDGKAMIAGHPKYCPEPVLVNLHGCIWGAGMMKMWFLAPGTKMEFQHPTFGVIRTSLIRDIRQTRPLAGARIAS